MEGPHRFRQDWTSYRLILDTTYITKKQRMRRGTRRSTCKALNLGETKYGCFVYAIETDSYD